MKIYTRKGDNGTTGLIGGARVPKNHIRIECYGTVDELNSVLGVVSDAATDRTTAEWVREIQDRLFTIGSELATSPGKDVKMKLPDLYEADLAWLETRMDEMNESLPDMKSFILPGGHLAASHAHVARCVCRRAERLAVALEQTGETIPQLIIPYLNRLSDFLFVLARHLAHKANALEIPWRARV